jgi:molecular chaperone GrpE
LSRLLHPKYSKAMEEDIRSAVEENTPIEEAAAEPVAAAEEQSAEKWAQEKAELEDLLRRRQAEFENFRRRMERERAEWAQAAGMDTVRGLLPILDDFERALKAARAAEGAAENDLIKGIELIYKRLLETLTRQGLEPIETAGQKFDPHVHEAVQRVEQEDAEDGAILDEYQRGYNFKGKLLRPAMVKVAVRP